MCGKYKRYILVVGLISMTALLSAPAQAQRKLEEVDISKPKPIVIKPTSGALAVAANLPDADIYLDGKKIGKTDKDGKFKPLTLKPKRYKILVKYPEYTDYFEEIDIVAGEPKSISAKLDPTFSIIILTVQGLATDAQLELDDKVLTEAQLKRDSKDGSIRIKTTPGLHTLKISQYGYLAETQKKDVVVGDENTIAMFMKLLPVTLIVKSQAGARLYIDGKASGNVAGTGELRSTLHPNQEYKLRLELADYEPLERTIKTQPNKEESLDAKLTPLPTSAAFEESFISGLSRWSTPQGWQADNGLLYVKGTTGVGLPKDCRYRDCDITFGLRLTKAAGAAWVVRARDDKNYYLFCLNGPNSKYPNQFRVYICQDGQYNLAEPADSALPLPITLKPGEDYRIQIKIRDNVIEHKLTPSSTGEDLSIGLFKDPRKSFPLGNMGFALLPEQDFIINAFTVTLPTDTKAVR